MEPSGTGAVAKLLRCSDRWARELTADARERERVERDAAFHAESADGKSNRAIAREHRVDEGTVRNVLGAAEKGKAFDFPHPATEPGPDPYAEARVSQSPTGQRWHRALEALRLVNTQAEVSAMFADRYTGVDHAVEPA